MAREEQRAPNLADQLNEERRKVAQLTAENQRLQKALTDCDARAKLAERDARSMAEDLRKASSGVLLNVGTNGRQLRESMTMSSGFSSESVVDGKTVTNREAIRPQRGDVLCAGTEEDVARLQSTLGKKAKVYRVTEEVLAEIMAAGLTES